MPIIAEDLGIVDAGVEKLRQRTGFPGMKIMLFAFDGEADNPYLPANVTENYVAYTGTHDNATVLGLLKRMTDAQFRVFKTRLREAMKAVGLIIPFCTREQAATALCMCVLASKANVAILPVQDLLGLDDGARMNVPSTAQGNWRFRLTAQPSRKSAAIMRKAVKEFNR